MLTDPIARMMDPDPRTRWSMPDAAQVLRRLAGGRGAPPATPPPPRPSLGSTRPGPAPRQQRTARRGPLATVLALALLVALGTAGYLLATGSGTGPDPTAPAPDERRSPPKSPPSSPGDSRSASPHPDQATRAAPVGKVGFVDRYFQTMPEDTDAGWSMLAASMQERVGRDYYESFWGSVDAVEAAGTTAVAGAPAVTTRLAYRFDDGEVVVERQRITLRKAGDGFRIVDDEVLSSRTVSE
jgi:hypothetical protein